MISRRIHRCLFDVPRSAVAKKRHVIPRFRSYGTQQSRNTGIKPDNTSTSSEPSMVLVLVPRILMAGGILYCAFEYVADITMCEGPSMTPTIQPYGEILLIDKWNLKIECNAEKRVQLALQKQRETSNEFWHEPHISVTDVPPYTWLQKWHHVRSSLNVGDVVVVDHPCRKARVCKRLLGLPGDVVLVNHTGKLVTIPDGHVWLEGDCPPNSSDSRIYGAVPAALIVGRAVTRIWPLRGWLKRGYSVRHPPGFPVEGVIVLPAGYQGQTIRKTTSE